MVKAGKNVEIENVAGLYVGNGDSTNITNTGVISVIIDAPEAKSVTNVAGIYIEDSTNVTLSNPGVIYLWNNAPNADIRTLSLTNSEVTLQDRFSIVFGQPGIEKSPIYVDSDSSLELNDTTLIAHVGTALKFNNPYYTIENNGTVNGNWGDLVKGYTNEDITVSWYGTDRGANSAVIFGYSPRYSIGAMGISSSNIFVANILNQIYYDFGLEAIKFMLLKNDKDRRVFLASATPTVSGLGVSSKEKASFFVFPFYSYVDANELGYDAKGGGFGLGFDFNPIENLKIGFYGVYGAIDVDFDIRGAKDEDQDLFGIGLYGNYLKKPWYIGLNVFGHVVNHDYSGTTGPNYELIERADYNTWGIEGRLTGGYIFSGNDWFIMPKIGFDIIYWRLNKYHTHATDPAWNKYYDSESDGYITGLAGVFGVKRWVSGATKIYLTGLLQVEQVIGENDIAINQSIPELGTGKVKVKEEINNTTFTGRLGIDFRYKDRYILGISGGGMINSDYQVYDGRILFRVAF